MLLCKKESSCAWNAGNVLAIVASLVPADRNFIRFCLVTAKKGSGGSP